MADTHTQQKPRTLSFTPMAQDHIKDLLDGQSIPGKYLRVFVEGGGCSGFQYGFAFDEERQDDTIEDGDGFRVLIDPFSLDYLKGSEVNYIDDLSGTGFKVGNPNAKGVCGCGHSFSV